jgi:tetratricopeptide (TPR) repeat protein
MTIKKKRKDPFREIQTCLQKRDYKGALGWFQALLEEDSKNTQIRLRYADTLVLAGSKKEAIKQYRIVADELAESGFMIRAIAINKKIVQLDPSQTDVHQKLAAMNDARSKGRSAAMAQLSAAITSDPGRPEPARAAAVPSPPPPKPKEPPPTPTMSLEDSLAMEFGESAQAATPPPPASPVDTPEPPVMEDEVLQIEEEPEPLSQDVEIQVEVAPPPGLEPDEQGFEIVSDEVDEGVLPTAGTDIEMDASAPAELSDEMPLLESEEGSTEQVLAVDRTDAGDEDGGDDVEFEIEMEPEAAADGKASLVGVLGEDIDALIDSIIDDVSTSAGGAPSPPPPKDTPGGIPLFSQLSMQEFIDVAVVLDRRSVKSGTVIVREGDPGDSLFIVSTGEVDATRDENGRAVRVATFRDGDFFGEMAVLTGEPRTATVTAVKNTELLELSRENLQQIFAKHPDVEAKIRLAYDERAMS